MLSFEATDAEFLEELAPYVAIPSISRDADAATMLAAAGMLVIGGVAALTIGGVFGVAVAIIAVVVAVLTAGFGGGIGARAAAALPQQSGCGNDCNCGGHSEPAADEQVAETPEAKANAAACGTASCGACALKDACQPAH